MDTSGGMRLKRKGTYWKGFLLIGKKEGMSSPRVSYSLSGGCARVVMDGKLYFSIMGLEK
jgi:hypothetical protein